MTWRGALTDLANQIVAWTEGRNAIPGVQVEHEQELVPVADEPLLQIDVAGRALLRLEPAGYAIDQVPTVVHLYAYPTMRRVRLVGPYEDGWKIQSREGIDMGYDWSAESFHRILDALSNESFPKAV